MGVRFLMGKGVSVVHALESLTLGARCPWSETAEMRLVQKCWGCVC